MKRKITAYAAAMALGAGMLAGCGGSDSTPPSSTPPPPPSTSPPPPSQANFTDFVKNLLTQPGNSQPAVVNGVGFVFPNLDNPDAFDDVLPPPNGTAAGAGG